MKVFRALVCVINPGIICPPIHLKFASTTLIVMQVPKSMVIIGGGTNLAAEIKPHAIKVTLTNFPNTIQLGDVREIEFAVMGQMYDVLNLSYVGRMKG